MTSLSAPDSSCLVLLKIFWGGSQLAFVRMRNHLPRADLYVQRDFVLLSIEASFGPEQGVCGLCAGRKISSVQVF